MNVESFGKDYIDLAKELQQFVDEEQEIIEEQQLIEDTTESNN